MKSKEEGRRQRAVNRLNAFVTKKHSGIALKLVSVTSWLLLAPPLLIAQVDTTQAHTVDMATTMRSNGKIYVVVAVLVIILLGLFLYLVRLDRKIGKLEKE